MFIKPTQLLLGHERLSGIFHYRWIISGIAIVVVVVLSYLKFFIHLPSDTKAILYRCRCFSRRRVGHRNGGKLLRYNAASNFQLSMLAAVEEGLEMAGVIVFINALLTYIVHHHEYVLLRFSDRKQNPSSVISINRHAA
jgi:hypothetical protein